MVPQITRTAPQFRRSLTYQFYRDAAAALFGMACGATWLALNLAYVRP